MKLLLVWAILTVSTLAEPPVNNRYLPPHQGVTSQIYRSPQSTRGFGVSGSAIRVRPSFGSPISRQPSQQYGVPAPSPQYGAPIASVGPVVPQISTHGFQTPSLQYGVPQGFQSRAVSPSALYGAPGFSAGMLGAHTPAQSRQYLPPGVGGYSGDAGSNEPANYSFEYMVQDAQSGNDFGHHETRLGDRAEGLYYVVLPDGRKQTVQYEADQDGYKPRISYEDTGLGIYRNGQNEEYHGGYHQGY